jgi:hypothetical protein
MNLATNTPYCSEHKGIHANFFDITRYLSIFQTVLLNKNVENVEVIMSPEVGSCRYSKLTLGSTKLSSNITEVVHLFFYFLNDFLIYIGS